MRHLYIGTPVYDQQVSTGYCTSLAMTIVACTKQRDKIHLSGPDFKGGPYIDCNRNWLVHRFLQSTADTLLFIDADVTWDENAVVRMYDSGMDFIGGAYPKKEDAENYPVKLLDNIADGLIEAKWLPGGFMMIRRKVFEAITDVPEYPEFGFGGEMMKAYFQNVYYPGGGFVGEDVEFCNRWRKLGGKCWFMPDIDFEHQGPKQWRGNYAKQA